MTAGRTRPVRLIARDGKLVESPPLTDASTGVVDLTILEIEAGRVVCAGAADGAPADTVYTALAEEALHLAARSLLEPGAQTLALRLHLDPPAAFSSLTGPLEAAAVAVRLGPRASTATVTVYSGEVTVGRGGLVSMVDAEQLPSARSSLHAI